MASDQIIEQIVPSGLLTGIKFGIMLGKELEKYTHVNIIESNDVTNAKLGLPNASSQCATCGAKDMKHCDGHFGIIKLPTAIYHPYLVSEVVQILNQICPGCKCIKQDKQMKGSFNLEATEKSMGEDAYSFEVICKNLKDFQRKLLMKLVKSKLSLPTRSILVRAPKFPANYFKKRSKVKRKISKKWASTNHQPGCKYCDRSGSNWYPVMKFKISSIEVQGKKSLSILAEVNEKLPKKFQNKSLSEVLPKDYWDFVPKDTQQQEMNTNKITLSPSQVFYLLKDVEPEFIEQFVSKRELLFLSCLPVTPNSHRVMETYEGKADGPQLIFDKRTKAYKRLVELSRKIDEIRQDHQNGGAAPAWVGNRVVDCLNVSKLRSKSSLSTDPSGKTGLGWIKEVLLSKRTDNAFRMTVIGDPKIKLGEIGVPSDVSESLFICEQVNAHNLKKLKMSCNLLLLTKEQLHSRSRGQLNCMRETNKLQIGDMFYRPLENGDLVLINRPPSVHKHSLIALSVKVLPIQSVISINPLCCAPFFGDFDGDCLHGYVPQSIGCRVELGELVTLDHQLLNGQDGRNLVSLTHDSLTAAYLLTCSEVFLNNFEMQQLEMSCPRQLQIPAILKAPNLRTPLWTGRQLFSMLLPTSLNFCLGYKTEQISNGEILSSPHESFWLQNTTTGIFSRIFKLCGSKALDILFYAQEVLCEWISTRGLSVSLSDVYLSSDPYSRMKMIDEVGCCLQEARDASYIKQLMVDPEMEYFLAGHDGWEDSSYLMHHELDTICKTPQKSAVLNQESVSAFKDVFRDLLSVTHQYANKENSMLAMIQAGSKGSLMKLMQQGVCLGLQQFPQKSLELHRMSQDTVEPAGGYNAYAVIKSSLLSGLNPLECFVHALSGRANLFSENAEVPGTLTRKLMFYMRDLYVAYDGTVRSPYGQQLVQFTYNVPEEASIQDGESYESNGLGGQPVGAWAACSISEAAYGALDSPMCSLKGSPLTNLKKVLESGQKRTSVGQTISLFLLKKLERWNYGFEYGALEVKCHLERVFLSDVVTTVMIVYAGDDVQERRFSPWVSHFHVNKEKMMRRRLTVQHIIDKVTKNYNSMREKMDIVLPKLCIMRKDCSLVNVQKGHDETFCIVVAIETSKSLTLLDSIRDMVIPVLLQTNIKGFMEFKKVDILWYNQPNSPKFHKEYCGELFLKVTMSEKCVPGKSWSALKSACIPIMDLIDWKRSHPDNIHDIFCEYGIDAAWKFFLVALKSAISDVGRTIHQEHLLMVADCLSVTGEFHGLNAKGMKTQRDHASISSPFSHAYFSNPSNCFINAAKQGSADHLYGSIDAVAWGKEVPIGTGGPFDIVCSVKVHNIDKPENIYKTLCSLHEVDKPRQDDTEVRTAHQNISNKWKGQSVSSNNDVCSERLDNQLIFDGDPMEDDRSAYGNPVKKWKVLAKGKSKFGNACTRSKVQTSLGFKSKSVSRSVFSWTNVVDMCSSLRTILHKYPINGYLNEADKSCLLAALIFHPRRNSKMENGVQEIKVGHSPLHPGSRCFVLLRKDGTTEDFSYRKCVIGAAKQFSPVFGAIVEKKLYRRR